MASLEDLAGIGNNLGILGLSSHRGNTSALGLEGAFPMPSDLNRAGAIIAGQEDPAIKQGAVNLQTMATLATLKQHQQEMMTKRAAQFSEILKTAKDFMPFIPEEERPKLAKSIAEKAKAAGHPLSDESIISAYLNKPDDGALAMATFSRATAMGKSPDMAIAEALQTTKDPELRKHLLTGFFQLAGKKQTVAESAVAALAKGSPLPGFSLEETKKMAGGLVEGNKALNQQAAAAIAKNQSLPGFTIEETKKLAGVGKETQPDQFSRLASEISARRSGKPAGSAVAELKGLKDEELVKKFLGEANLAEALMAMLGLGGNTPAGQQTPSRQPAIKYPTNADVKAAMDEAKGDQTKAKEILRKKGFNVQAIKAGPPQG